jgi:hypothetical protein
MRMQLNLFNPRHPLDFYRSLRIACGLLMASVAAMSHAQEPWQASPELVKKLSGNRGEFNYVEADVPEYQLPDPLRLSSGITVASPQMWQEQRRPELLELFRSQVYGRRPATDYQVEFIEEGRQQDVLGGLGTGRSVRAVISIGDRQYSFPFTALFPKTSAPVPGIVLINNRYFTPLDKAVSEKDDFWPVEMLLRRGYATATFHTSDVDPDKADGYADGIRAFFANGAEPDDDAWRSLSAWGWAASRLLDYFEQQADVDATRVAVVGHSRGGKTALWAASEDERFAIGYSNNSGCGGAALSRRAYGETVGRITSVFPHWFTPNFAKYAGREHELPIDQHQLIALLAPRGVYVTSADEDLWADPKGEYASLVAAAPVFQLFGKEAVEETQMPPLDAPRSVGVTGYHIRRGAHALQDNDWQHFLDFADRLLK